MFRIAEGEPLGYDDPPARGHSIEFRINAEDPGRNFLPAPGTITAWNPRQGLAFGSMPGTRPDDGPADVRLADRQADRDRRQPGRGTAALGPRAGRVEVGGMPTVLPFHRAVVADPAFAGEPLRVHTRWIETEFARRCPRRRRRRPFQGSEPAERSGLTVEVAGNGSR